ncbi:MAG TPA: PilZ domain-containing protein [Dongiaceae bacterium]|nr:PilZ domain-containing protein [Dongiaceae bacterium]
MPKAKDPLFDPWRRYGGEDLRRSSRVKCTLPLMVYGQNLQGEKFVERTQVIDLNLHGCGFLSRHSCQPGSYVTLRFGGERYEGKDKVVRAQVKRSDFQADSRKLSRVGVELGIPGNVWSYSPIPLDWRRLLTPAPVQESSPVPVVPEMPSFDVPPVPSIPQVHDNEPVEIRLELAPVVPEVPAADLLPKSAAQEQIQNAVAAAISEQMDLALSRALSTLELQTRASMRQLRESTTQRQATNANPRSKELETLFNERLADIRTHWDHQLDGYLLRMEESAKRMERFAAAAEEKLSVARQIIDNALLSFSQQLQEQVNYAVSRAGQIVAQKAAVSVDHQLVRLTEDAHFVAREINSTVEADAAAARVEMRNALHSILEELRAHSGAHAKLLAADAKQRVASSFAALDAEHQALIDARRRSLDEEILQTGAKVSNEFRHSLKAFFYSCLVAAVGAVEEHSKSTLDGLAFDPELKPPLPKP